MATSGTREQFVAELDGDIKFHESWTKRWTALQWVGMVLVAIAGAITAAAAAPGAFGQAPETGFWFQSPVVLFISGVVTTIGALINQFFDPRGRAETHRNKGVASWVIRGAVRFQCLEIDQAQRLRALAQTSPEEVIKQVSERPPTPRDRPGITSESTSANLPEEVIKQVSERPPM